MELSHHILEVTAAQAEQLGMRKVEVDDMKATELYKPADSQTSSDIFEST